ncbi:CU044_2847 family protein [Sphaerisporangium dianthi]|uniref:CU044_2847 family protein n=1 Tax=Sphaerisporangium dianthi TaxID=1436120 RepID=A0ABV9CLQ4_9ACTN
MDDGSVIVEIDEADRGGFQSASISDDGIVFEAHARFEDALQNIKKAAAKTLAILREDVLKPDDVELEFGVKFNAAVGAVIAKTSTEAHMTVKLSWSRTRP